ncbi:hypothetical protein ACNQ1X_01065 [Mycoplasma sp. SK341A]|uniref:hypothetical protein n=1 Tax=Mycoplasma sp. SK341A TaxID=3401679 RepID=UPI003AAF0BBD
MKNFKSIIFSLGLAGVAVAPMVACQCQPEAKPVKKEDASNSIKAPIIASYKSIKDGLTTDAQKAALDAYVNKEADGLAAQSLAVLNAVSGVLPEAQNKTVAELYNLVALKLNSALVEVLQASLASTATGTGIERVKNALSAEKMTAIKNEVADILIANSDKIANIGKAIFETLKTNESTKNIATLDAFINGMTTFFNTEIKAVANQVKSLTVEGNASMAVLDQFKALMPELKTKATAKAHELLTQEADYNAVKAVLKSKYEALEASVKSNVALLVSTTKELAELINTLTASTATTTEAK